MRRRNPENEPIQEPAIQSKQRGSRGQTTQDFAIGISLFLVAVTLVFGIVPTVLMPYDSTVTGSQAAQADRVATTILDTAAVEGTTNRIDPAALPAAESDLATLQTETGVSSTTRINITLENVTTGTQAGYNAGVRVPESVDTTTRTRIVRTTDARCTPGCRLVVEVW